MPDVELKEGLRVWAKKKVEDQGHGRDEGYGLIDHFCRDCNTPGCEKLWVRLDSDRYVAFEPDECTVVDEIAPVTSVELYELAKRAIPRLRDRLLYFFLSVIGRPASRFDQMLELEFVKAKNHRLLKAVQRRANPGVYVGPAFDHHVTSDAEEAETA